MYEFYDSYWKRKRRFSVLAKAIVYLNGVKHRLIDRIERAIVGTRNTVAFTFLAFAAFLLGLVGALIRSLILLLRTRRIFYQKIGRPFRRIRQRIARSKDDVGILHLYRLMETAEATSLRQHIMARDDIAAWYSPTAFWPQFNDIDKPRLTCIPDMLLSEFPIAFAALNGDRFLQVFRMVSRTIAGGDHFVTYSEHVKRQILMARYHVPQHAISVIPHGANRLDDLITVSLWDDHGAATRSVCLALFERALLKKVGPRFCNKEINFIFYASQLRPNKNMISLLRAYENLLRKSYIGHKLVLTGDPNVLPDVAKFIVQHGLENDVLWLRKLSSQELAACYSLADLSVNPSISEGGCPFTFSESLSVGTPVVMARIPVTEEVITDSDLQRTMLFDPYDWRDIAARIEWALQNKDNLLERQLAFYKNISARSWRDVVDDHISLLDRISQSAVTTKILS
jgi:glycosyltransferase involved in cell wall biosynthesis